MEVGTSDLRRIFESLIAHLEQTTQSTFEIEQDFYWDISAEERYNPYSEPRDLSLGQLSDDWRDLLSIANGDMPPVGPALIWLSSVLRATGEATKQ